jgi:RibD C-terminal domain
MQDFAEIWQAADKIVYSKTLETVSSARTRIERDFDPEAVRQLKARAVRDITVGGPEFAAQATKAGLVDEWHLLVTPIVVGGGKQSLAKNVRVNPSAVTPSAAKGGNLPMPHKSRRIGMTSGGCVYILRARETACRSSGLLEAQLFRPWHQEIN